MDIMAVGHTVSACEEETGAERFAWSASVKQEFPVLIGMGGMPKLGLFTKGLSMARDLKDIRKDILDKFRAIDGEENDQIPEDWLRDEYLPYLNAYELKDFEKAIRQLAAKGFLKYKWGAVPKLRLTEKGANLIH